MRNSEAHTATAASIRTQIDEIDVRLNASKRYRGRKADTNERDLLEAAVLIHEGAAARYAEEEKVEQAEYDAWEQEDVAATQRASDGHQAFRARVATRAYFMALDGEGESDHERWLWAEAQQRGADIQAKRDASSVRYFGEWRTPHDVECEERMVGLQ